MIADSDLQSPDLAEDLDFATREIDPSVYTRAVILQPWDREHADELNGSARFAPANDGDSPDVLVAERQTGQLQQARLQIHSIESDATKRGLETPNDSFEAGERDEGQLIPASASQPENSMEGLHRDLNEPRSGISKKKDESRSSAKGFPNESRARSPRGQASADSQWNGIAQLLRDATSAAHIEHVERNALRQELRQNNSDSTASGLAGANLSDVSKRLESAATKLDKAVSSLRGLSILKD